MTAPHRNLWSKAPLFRSLEAGQLDRIGALLELRQREAGQLLFVAGEPCEGFYIVLDGAVELLRTSEEGVETLLNVVRPGQSFAEAALFSGGTYPATARVLEPALLAKVPGAPFIGLLRSDPDLCLRMLEGLAAWHHRLTFQVQQLRASDSGARLRRWLGEEARRAPGQEVLLRMPKKVLAAQLGMAPETFSRHLRHLRDQGLVSVEGALIRVLGDLEG